MNVSACIVTRGDVDLVPVLRSIPSAWELCVWDNAVEEQDLAVYGRYHAAFERATHDTIYVQDDDCVLAPESFDVLTRAWYESDGLALVANMPEPFRHAFYEDHCLVGFGALFDRRLARDAFDRFALAELPGQDWPEGMFARTCDVIFTTLTPRVLVDAPYEDLPWADTPDRMWRQPTHVQERRRALDLARKVRDS